MQVKLVDLRAQYRSIQGEIDEAIARVHERGNYVMGEEVERFEEAWARYCGVKHCVAVSSGTDALYLVLKAIDMGRYNLKTIDTKYKSCVVPTRTFFAAAEAVMRAGHRLTLTDRVTFGDTRDGTIFIPTNLYGAPSGFERPNADVFVLEDACQSHGAKPYGDAAAYSFYPTKNLGAMGQAGAVVTNDGDLSGQIRVLRAHGELEQFKSWYASGNYRMDELQAAVLNAKLPYLDIWNTRRRRVASLYSGYLAGIEGIVLPEDSPQHVYYAYPIRSKRRDDLAKFLETVGIQTAVRYPVPLHLQPALRFVGHGEGDFPEAEAWAREHLCLPVHEMMTDEQVEYTASAIRRWVLNGC